MSNSINKLYPIPPVYEWIQNITIKTTQGIGLQGVWYDYHFSWCDMYKSYLFILFYFFFKLKMVY